MTARWSGVFREQRRQRHARGGSRRRTPAGFPTALDGQPPKRVFLLRVLVTRNVGCRSGFEASRRCVQGKPQGPTRSTSPSDRKAKGPDGAVRHSLRERVRRRAEVERPMRALDRGTCESLVLDRASAVGPQPWIESVEGAWGLDTGER
jgi:hypothetical protein